MTKHELLYEVKGERTDLRTTCMVTPGTATVTHTSIKSNTGMVDYCIVSNLPNDLFPVPIFIALFVHQ